MFFSLTTASQPALQSQGPCGPFVVVPAAHRVGVNGTEGEVAVKQLTMAFAPVLSQQALPGYLLEHAGLTDCCRQGLIS